jgi:hypothetical protein
LVVLAGAACKQQHQPAQPTKEIIDVISDETAKLALTE